jgi:hypothetical protein
MTDNKGWIYCLSNISMPGLVKIGITQLSPKKRAIKLHTTGVPTPFKIEIAKKVEDYIEKEKQLHKILEQYSLRISPKREFFKMSVEEVYAFFELMEGVYYEEEVTEVDIDIKSYDTDDDLEVIKHSRIRVMCKVFFHEQKIRHIIGISNLWEAYYDKNKNKIIYKNEEYSLNKFTQKHYMVDRPDRCKDNNAWAECECLVNNKWISTYDLKTLC